MMFQREEPTAVPFCVRVDLCYDIIKIEKNCATLHIIMLCRIYPTK